MIARAVLFALALSGCKEPAKSTAPPTPSGSPLMPALASAAAPKAAPEAWYVGTWTGTYEAAKHRIELPTKVGGLPEWAVDEGPRGTGPGTVRLTPDASGATTGTVEGPLGPAALEGAFDGETLAARFFPKTDERTGFSGVMVARRDGDRLTGSLDAATSDGHVARTAKVTLQRATP